MVATTPPSPSREEFEKDWVRPSYALVRLLDVGDAYVVNEMYRRLCNGRLVAAGTNSTDQLRIIDVESWKRAKDVGFPSGMLWRTNGVRINKYVGGGSFVDVDYFGVRFEPESLQRLADDIGLDLIFSPARRLAKAVQTSAHARPVLLRDLPRLLSEPPVQDPRPAYNPRPVGTLEQIAPELAAFRNVPKEAQAPPKGDVAHAEIVTWFEGLTAAEQLLSGKRLWALSKTAFHPRRVLRKQFDWITEQRAPGPRKAK
jgi:hypothetical protein